MESKTLWQNCHTAYQHSSCRKAVACAAIHRFKKVWLHAAPPYQRSASVARRTPGPAAACAVLDCCKGCGCTLHRAMSRRMTHGPWQSLDCPEAANSLTAQLLQRGSSDPGYSLRGGG
eukprot:30593-Chlamydomonas_euryale.AAC.3